MIHEVDPQSRLLVIIDFAHVVLSYVRPSVPTSQNKTNFQLKQWSLLARLWVWPSGSLMKPVLLCLSFNCSFRSCTSLFNWVTHQTPSLALQPMSVKIMTTYSACLLILVKKQLAQKVLAWILFFTNPIESSQHPSEQLEGCIS